jgi:hypothetical protein
LHPASGGARGVDTPVEIPLYQPGLAAGQPAGTGQQRQTCPTPFTTSLTSAFPASISLHRASTHVMEKILLAPRTSISPPLSTFQPRPRRATESSLPQSTLAMPPDGRVDAQAFGATDDLHMITAFSKSFSSSPLCVRAPSLEFATLGNSILVP